MSLILFSVEIQPHHIELSLSRRADEIGRDMITIAPFLAVDLLGRSAKRAKCRRRGPH